jgi:hypothetical protein
MDRILLPSQNLHRLFIVSMNRNVIVQEVFDKGVEGLRFRRAMVGELRNQWCGLKRLLERVNMNNDPDRLIWKLKKFKDILS